MQNRSLDFVRAGSDADIGWAAGGFLWGWCSKNSINATTDPDVSICPERCRATTQ